MFHLVGNQLRKDAVGKNISKETFEQLFWRIKKSLLNFSPAIISKTTESINKRGDGIIASKGEKTKY